MAKKRKGNNITFKGWMTRQGLITSIQKPEGTYTYKPHEANLARKDHKIIGKMKPSY